jgi:hypothetical protein
MLDSQYQDACKAEYQRLTIAEKWAAVNLSTNAKQFNKGKKDRLAGKVCASTNGNYLDGFYSVAT